VPRSSLFLWPFLGGPSCPLWWMFWQNEPYRLLFEPGIPPQPLNLGKAAYCKGKPSRYEEGIDSPPFRVLTSEKTEGCPWEANARKLAGSKSWVKVQR
jgi:hypothetical protein